MDDAPLPDAVELCDQAAGPADVDAQESSSSSDSDSTLSSESDVLTDTDRQKASRVIGLPTPAEGTQFLVAWQH